MVKKLRAVSSDEKLERRETILNAAVDLLGKGDFQNISVSRIARKAGLAKGTIFLYFKTKEDLFLQLQIREYKSWFENFKGRLKASLQRKKFGDIEEFVKNIMDSLACQPLMLQLTPILHIILEQNIDYETALDFKKFLLAEVLATGELVEQCLPFFSENDGARFLLHFQALLIGIIQLSRPAPVVKKVIETEKMEVFQLRLEEKLSEMLTIIVNGMKTIRSS
ncbi:MAG: TetR family transcriptional regulator [Nitrospinota bacterium]|nr:TetR family transcriptional regulator [Nitrospinota bacterium]